MTATQILDSMKATWTDDEILETSRLGLSPEDAASIGDAGLAAQVLGLVRLEAARIVGTWVGRCIAAEMKLDTLSQRSRLLESDLSGEDGDQAAAVGIEPGTQAWREFVSAAKAAYRMTASV